MPHVLLEYMVDSFVRASPEPEQYAADDYRSYQPPHLRIDFHELDPDGARRADLPDLLATPWGDGFCTVHPCAPPLPPGPTPPHIGTG